MNTLTRYTFRIEAVLEAFEEAIDYAGLRYSTADLQQYGFQDEEEVHRAVQKAIRICQGLETNPRKHFRPYYEADATRGLLIRKWRVSPLGFYLVLCNGEPENPYVGAFQMQLIKEFIRLR